MMDQPTDAWILSRLVKQSRFVCFGKLYYNGELIYQPEQRWTKQQQLELLLWHPLFTGRCPDCGAMLSADSDRVHWDCDCGWKDDSV